MVTFYTDEKKHVGDGSKKRIELHSPLAEWKQIERERLKELQDEIRNRRSDTSQNDVIKI
ncbi:hypothetical protein [Jiella pacifica]|uniref:Uncharacterized protein n=1 Tax=Jiella pacifica TaxID=2696469 RepID=A0A6N9TC28_9HYPH|nr:hypothetical protein [Jiella pacifica]NDW07785.1 hypothetical protein [Jiella pacifica]